MDEGKATEQRMLEEIQAARERTEELERTAGATPPTPPPPSSDCSMFPVYLLSNIPVTSFLLEFA